MLRAEPVQSETAVDSNERLQRALASGNARRFAPRRSAGDFDAELEQDVTLRRSERTFVEAERAAIKSEARAVPTDPAQFAAWFESLTETHGSASDALSSWLGSEATSEQAEWLSAQTRAPDLRFEDLLALTRVNMPASSKLELARSYWEEMSLGEQSPLFQRRPTAVVDTVVQPAIWEALAVDNLMAALATARHYAYQSLGALGMAEHPARHGVGAEGAVVHPVFGRNHSTYWSREVLAPLVSKDASLAPLIAEGALMRLRLVARRDARYLQLLKDSSQLVAHFEYAEDSSAPASPPTAPPTKDAPFATPEATAVRPVRWRDVSARAAH
jgi:hypothetical protein